MKKILIIFLIFPVGSLFAQLFPTLGGQRAGISAVQFLKIGVGGRAASLGDAFVAVANDASSLYWNPAGAVQAEGTQILISQNYWVADINHQFAGGIYHFSKNDAVGLSLTALNTDDMPVTTEFMPFGTGEYFSFGDFAVGLTYSRQMTEQFSFGITLRYVEETLDKLKMRGVVLDLGTLYWTGLGTTRFAVAITNFGNEFTPGGKVLLWGKREKSDWQSFSPPIMFRMGFAFDPYQTQSHRITASVQLNHPNDNSENVSAGLEYSWKEIFYLRAGYKFNVEEQNYSFGTGISVPLGIAKVTFDYGFANFERLGSAHRLSILLALY